MKTLILVAVIILTSCSVEDPKPKFNCEELKADSDKAYNEYQSATKVVLLPTAADYEVKKKQDNVSQKKAIYVEKYTLWSKNCK